MSSRSTPITSKFGIRDSTPKSSIKPKPNLVKAVLLKRSSAFDLSTETDNFLNTAFSSPAQDGNPSTPKTVSGLKIKSKSSTTLNSGYTPTPLYKSISIAGTPNKNLAVTPKPLPRKRDFVEQRTPECFSKVSIETPIRRSNKNELDETKSKEGEISNLIVAVRVRPMNARELSSKSVTNIISVEDNRVTVNAGCNADNTINVSNSFQLDQAFYSCNSEHEDYATQLQVFKGTAVSLLENAFEGYNACLFAYGMTGSGKSYSMMGIDSDDELLGPNSEAGIIPRFCQELFRRINEVKSKIRAEIEVSYFEIYNEKIHDLLAVSPTGLQNTVNCTTKKSALRVREHPIWGPYVVDLSTHPVDSHSAIRNWLAVGNSQRATAATGMNDKSSRSHSIFNIVLNLSEVNGKSDKVQQTKRSKISLVDLAGSERVSHTCAIGDRLKEGVSINKSLLTLGKVIASLADSRKSSAGFVPYRESVLTWLLRENLGGNSRTVMLATISPASTHIDETLATLRYACQARTIVNRVKVNEDPHDRIIRELRAEVERLQVLGQDYDRQKRHSASAPPRKIIIETSVDEAEVDALRQQLAETEQELVKAQTSWRDRLKEADDNRKTEMKMLRRKGLALELSVENKQPCLVNLAADPILSGTLLYTIPPGVVKIGRDRPSAFGQPDIVLDGPLVAFHHCSIDNRNGKLTLIPENTEFETFVNGEMVYDKIQLFHGDRLVIGGSHYFRISNPDCPNRSKNMMVDFQLAHQEVLREQEKCLRRELDVEKEAALLQIETERQANEQNYKEKMASLELEKFKYKCSKELLETEKRAMRDQEKSPEFKYTPYKSTILDDIKRIMERPSEESLHQTQMMVREATQRCRDIGVNYEFKQTQIADEFGIFRAVVNIIDRDNCRLAEWPTARLEVWLELIRENDYAADRLFSSVDVDWKEDEQDFDTSVLNESLNSSRISLNLTAVKDAILGTKGSKQKLNRSPLNNNTRNDMLRAAVYNNSTGKKNNIKKTLFEDDENTPVNSTSSPLRSGKKFETSASHYLKDVQSSTLKLKKLCKSYNTNDETAADHMASKFLKSIEDMEFIIQEMKFVLTERSLNNSPTKTPKSVRFLVD